MLPLPRAVEVRLEDQFLPSLGATRPVMGFHISIIGPFFWTTADTAEPLARLREVCAQTRLPQLVIHGIDIIENAPDDCAVFLTVRPVRVLRSLQQSLLQVLGNTITPQYHRAGPFRPHITIGLGLPSRVAQTLGKSAASSFHACLDVAELWLVEQRHQSPWRSLLALSLGSAAEPRGLDAESADG